jgi:hypothetical protein
VTFAVEFDDWQGFPPPATHSACSPNLILLLGELQRRWGGFSNLGCFGRRPIRGGTAPSSHWNGAALDVGYPADRDELVRDQVVPFLIARSQELGVQAVHDYRRSRIWRAGRTALLEDACGAWWKAQRRSEVTGMGQGWCNHLHVETTAGRWGDDTPIRRRWVE